MIYNNWKYIKGENGYEVQPDVHKEIPDYFIKYYALSKYNCDAFLNGYLFFSHPLIINDPFDSCFQLVKLDKFSERQFVKLVYKNRSIVNPNFDMTYEQVEYQIGQYYKNDKTQLQQLGLTFFWNFIFKDHGILSLTTNEKDMLMWSYYSQHLGFAVKLRTDIFKSNKAVFGPFPMNYCDKYQTLSPRSIKLSPEELIYVTNVKSNRWKHEDEWRFILNKENMSVPNYNNSNLSENKRKVYYKKEEIERIFIGYKFFSGNVTGIDVGENKELYKFNPDSKLQNEDWLKVQILNKAINEKIEIFGIETEDNNTFDLKTVEYDIRINELNKDYIVERKY